MGSKTKGPRKKQAKAGAIVFTKRETELLHTVHHRLVEEVTVSMTALLDDRLIKVGIDDGKLHALQHKTLTAVLPWIESRVKTDQKKALFWERMSEIAGHVLQNVLQDGLVMFLRYLFVLIIVGALWGSYHDVLHRILNMLVNGN